MSSVDSYSPTVITPKPAVKGGNKGVLIMAMVTAVAILVAVGALLRGPRPDPTTPTVTVGKTPTTDPTTTKPPPAEPFDFAKIYFGPSERPGGYVFQQPGTGLPRNPMVCKDTPEIEVLVKILDDIGLQNVARSDVKQGYLSAWFRWEVAFVALESPISTRLETEFQAMQTPENRWTYRKGDVLVLAWTRRKENRDVFSDLVLRLQKKLGIADQAPEIPLQHLTLEKSIAPDGFTFTVDVQDPASQTPREISVLNLKVQGAVQRFAATISVTETGAGVLTYSAINFVTPQAAAAAEKRLASHVWPATAHVLRTEVLRSGGTVAVLLLLSPEVHLYERVASQVRQLLGLADHTFDTIIPVAGEMPAGYQLGETRSDVAAIVKDLGIDNVSPTQVARAWQAKVKPAGSIVVLQVEETDVRSRIREELKKRGASEENSGTMCAFGVEGPDEETLDALENLLRFKFGWDATTPRPVLIHRLQLKPSDLPEGYSLEGVVFEKRLWKAELRGPQGALQFVARESHNYAEIDAIRKELAPKPGDVQLFRYAIVSQVTNPGGEAAWPALDALEATLRKKMRLGPPTADEYSLEKTLPPNCQLIPRRDVGFAVNPRLLKSPVAVQQAVKEVWAAELPGFIRGWAALIQPAETQVWILEAPDGAKMSDLVARVRKAVPAAKNVAIHEKGSIVAVVRSDRPDDGEFKAVDQIVRAKLRAK